MMLVGQAGVRAANDGNFPKIYGELDSNGNPKKGLLLAAVENDRADGADYPDELQRR
ncbi:lysine/cadaverine antiporter [Raoultella terrigena]|uniref:Lysine/cadaverine antiporter n=1 Tax=Raoultella terrigena TaxID=577 RepID=A0A4U9DF47_RAOTE|nr:lysine/cadaverine antiporter [Raoultella terrigena]